MEFPPEGSQDKKYAAKMTVTVEPKLLVSSLKGEVKKKHKCNGWSFSCFTAHLFEQDLF